MRIQPLVVIAIAASAQAQTGGDLAVSPAIISATMLADRIEFEYAGLLTNIGDQELNLLGTDPTDVNDNVGFRTFLSNTADASDELVTAGESLFANDFDTLVPGRSVFRSFQADTLGLADPTTLGNFRWLVVDIINSPEPDGNLGNNRAIILIPSPGVTVVGLVGVAAAGRRRG